jgi:Ca2+-transporting ATPase
MERLVSGDFDVKAKHSSEEALQKWRKLCGVVKNPKRRFRFTANLSKRYEAAAMRKTNQVYNFSSSISTLSFLLPFFLLL